MKSIPFFGSGVPCGFPSPADDHLEAALSLDDHLVARPAATYMVRANGDSMINAGIHDGDLLIVDRSLAPVDGDVVVVALDGQLTCKILDRRRGRLLPANSNYPAIPIWEGQELIVEGVVKASVRYHRGD
ncbi:translesion error-prone DNA polymerase V autoproteolytic subunit [Microbulbifer variabilis]|uniref:Translesion error-prone DNA polymerase V autoproteolytic subunit n=1 Tax=Microbulbifer variabilis TaxID=266805 RepID=A0ABY4VCU2_9GAMM|nr:translesion error-prone DNA polymerase V autoproteolytic subunit [Microbulbifer variabilis]USD19794.1 translesion error-prone DNA polymerase V autoproteolytic subunit [Microbulbifer variabilis]